MKVCPKCQKQYPDDANFCPVDAARLVALENDAGRDAFAARFELGPQIGGSRTGAVHRATDKTTGAACAVKLVAPAVVALPGLAQRLDRELRQLERVSSAGVVKVIGSGKRDDTPWVAMELVDNAHTLAEAIAARGPIAAEQAAELIEVIGESLVEAAQVGVVHRDLAPKNVFITSGQGSSGKSGDAAIKLVNFSLPVPADKVPGVAEFVAPEQLDGRPVDQRSNLYSLGALFYYVLAGQPPETGGAVTPPSQLVGTIAAGSALEGVILRALEKSPTKRFLTVRQFVDEVARAGRGEVIVLDKPIAAPRRARAELVSTLMGMSKSGSSPVRAPVSPSALAASSAAFAPAGSSSAKVEMEPSSSAAVTLVDGVPALSGAPAAAARATVVTPPVVAPPVVAAPVVAAGKADHASDRKGAFRETLWFKKGDLDAKAAVAAAEERARSGKLVDNDKADSLPMDERYKDDGTITRGDKEKYSLRTGGTMAMKQLRDGSAGASGKVSKVSEDELIGEMKSGRKIVLAAIAVGVIAIIAIVLLLVL